MIEHLTAVRDRVAALGFDAYVGQVPRDAPYPSASIQAPGYGVGDDIPLCGPGEAIDAPFRVLVTDLNEHNVHVGLAKIRADLSPGGLDARLVVEGRYATTTYVRSEFVGADTSVTYGQTNRHPAVGVDTYQLDSQPTA